MSMGDTRMCIVEDCDSHDPVKGCMVSHNNHRFGPIACEWGRFETSVTERFGDLGDWKFRGIGSGGDALVATLKSRLGRVEIWGGSFHRSEVWAIPKGTDGCLISTRVTRDAVEMACNRVGIQRRLVTESTTDKEEAWA
jgi:hypothetical protein